MALILCLETSSVNCSVALFRDSELLAIKEEGESYVHAEKLHLFIRDVLNEAGVPAGKLDAVAVAEGPGSFTGLRIGVAAAKGLCYAMGMPMLAVSSLRTMFAMARSVADEADETTFFCPMIDARRSEVYCQLFNKQGEVAAPAEAKILDNSSFDKELSVRRIVFFGSGMPKWSEIVSHSNAQFIGNIQPSAKWMMEEVLVRWRRSEFSDVAYFEPAYLKDFHATTSKKGN